MSHIELSGIMLDLERYPPTTDASLQAWEAADEYLLQKLAELEAEAPIQSGPLLILNDNFGALACALHGRHPHLVSDSFLSEEAVRRNLARNGLAPLPQQDVLAPLPANPALVLIKVPKTLALLEQQLLLLREVVTEQTLILAGAKSRDIHSSTLQLFERIIGPTRTTLAWKKARLIQCQITKPGNVTNPYPTCWQLEESGELICNHANLFSRGSLDIGARFFMQHLPANMSGTLADLGCGNGVIGLTALAKNPDARLLFVDESHMAIASSRENVSHNRPQDLSRCDFMLGNSLTQQPADSLQAVLCNPPFHQQQTITDDLAWQMFCDAKRCLVSGGELWIVGNRHLGYHAKLPRLFERVETIASNQKFVILRAIKS
ncbi:MAG: 23S rRNA (guanine(1835)-N(2))-methyltransferase RlmG [Aeromonadaceae bacterium]